jgi:hypothetical protein
MNAMNLSERPCCLEHLLLLNDERSARKNGSGGPHPNGLTGQASFPKEVAWSQNGDDRFFAAFTDDRKSYISCLYIDYARGWIALRVDDVTLVEFFDFSCNTSGVQKGLRIEPAFLDRDCLGHLDSGTHN